MHLSVSPVWHPLLLGEKFVVSEELSFYEINNVYQLHKEATTMNNCLASFASSCSEGAVQVFALRDGDFADPDAESIASLTVHRPDGKTFEFHDLTTPDNGKPDEEIVQHAGQLINYLNSGQVFSRTASFTNYQIEQYGINCDEIESGVKPGVIPWRAIEYYKNDIWIWKRGRGQKEYLEFLDVLDTLRDPLPLPGSGE
jgi:hypothetical protein